MGTRHTGFQAHLDWRILRRAPASADALLVPERSRAATISLSPHSQTTVPLQVLSEGPDPPLNHLHLTHRDVGVVHSAAPRLICCHQRKVPRALLRAAGRCLSAAGARLLPKGAPATALQATQPPRRPATQCHRLALCWMVYARCSWRNLLFGGTESSCALVLAPRVMLPWSFAVRRSCTPLVPSRVGWALQGPRPWAPAHGTLATALLTARPATQWLVSGSRSCTLLSWRVLDLGILTGVGFPGCRYDGKGCFPDLPSLHPIGATWAGCRQRRRARAAYA